MTVEVTLGNLPPKKITLSGRAGAYDPVQGTMPYYSHLPYLVESWGGCLPEANKVAVKVQRSEAAGGAVITIDTQSGGEQFKLQEGDRITIPLRDKPISETDFFSRLEAGKGQIFVKIKDLPAAFALSDAGYSQPSVLQAVVSLPYGGLMIPHPDLSHLRIIRQNGKEQNVDLTKWLKPGAKTEEVMPELTPFDTVEIHLLTGQAPGTCTGYPPETAAAISALLQRTVSVIDNGESRLVTVQWDPQSCRYEGNVCKLVDRPAGRSGVFVKQFYATEVVSALGWDPWTLEPGTGPQNPALEREYPSVSRTSAGGDPVSVNGVLVKEGDRIRINRAMKRKG
jgi:hypothetical protein